MVLPERQKLFLLACVCTLLLAVALAHDLGPVAQTRPLAAALVAGAALLGPFYALTRVAATGCAGLVAALALHLVARALERPALEAWLLFAAPGLANLMWGVGLRPVLERLEAGRAMGRVDATTAAVKLAPFLAHRAAAVRAQAARRLGGLCPPAEALPLLIEASARGQHDERRAAYAALLALARHPDGWKPVGDLLRERVRDQDDARAAAAAETLAQLDALGDLVASEAPNEGRPAVRLAYAEGLLRATSASDGTGSRCSLAATLLAQLLADPSTDAAVRASALEAMDRVPGREARAAACPLLARPEVTPELLWVFAEHGQPEDAPLLARWVAVDAYEACNAAIEALEGIVSRKADLAAHAAATRAALEAGRARLRGVHPAGDNRLADALVGRIEALEETIAPG